MAAFRHSACPLHADAYGHSDVPQARSRAASPCPLGCLAARECAALPPPLCFLSAGVQNRLGGTFFALAFLGFTSLTTGVEGTCQGGWGRRHSACNDEAPARNGTAPRLRLPSGPLCTCHTHTSALASPPPPPPCPVDLLITERQVVTREVRGGYYSPSAYLLSKLTLDASESENAGKWHARFLGRRTPCHEGVQVACVCEQRRQRWQQQLQTLPPAPPATQAASAAGSPVACAAGAALLPRGCPCCPA